MAKELIELGYLPTGRMGEAIDVGDIRNTNLGATELIELGITNNGFGIHQVPTQEEVTIGSITDLFDAIAKFENPVLVATPEDIEDLELAIIIAEDLIIAKSNLRLTRRDLASIFLQEQISVSSKMAGVRLGIHENITREKRKDKSAIKDALKILIPLALAATGVLAAGVVFSGISSAAGVAVASGASVGAGAATTAASLAPAFSSIITSAPGIMSIAGSALKAMSIFRPDDKKLQIANLAFDTLVNSSIAKGGAEGAAGLATQRGAADGIDEAKNIISQRGLGDFLGGMVQSAGQYQTLRNGFKGLGLDFGISGTESGLDDLINGMNRTAPDLSKNMRLSGSADLINFMAMQNQILADQMTAAILEGSKRLPEPDLTPIIIGGGVGLGLLAIILATTGR